MLLLEDKISKLVNSITDIPNEFGTIDDSDDDYYYWDVVHQAASAFPDLTYDGFENEARWFMGASKLVFDVGSSFVIKIPFIGSHEYCEEYDEELDEYTGEGEDIFSEFKGANDADEDDCWDYCAKEARVYQMAKEAGFGDFFLETKLYGGHRNCCYPFYIQEKAEEFYSGKKSHLSSEKSEQYAKSHFTYNCNFNGVCRLPVEWTGRAIDLYGEDKVKDFLIFLKEAKISDLHTGNIGYTKDGKPVIFDYSGFSN